jgi:hypothetical protein
MLPAQSTVCTVMRILTKKRTMSGSVTVTDLPSNLSLQFGNHTATAVPRPRFESCL